MANWPGCSGDLRQRLRSTLASCWPPARASLRRAPAAARRASAPAARVSGRLRVDSRTKHLCQRLRRGEIAVIDHADLDGTSAYALVERGAAAVVNAANSITGRYPNSGPGILLQADIPLLDACGPETLRRLREGQRAELRGDELWIDGTSVVSGSRLTAPDLEARLETARKNLVNELKAFSSNTLEYLSREADVAAVDLQPPPLKTNFRNRPVLVVVRGEGYKQDLQWVEPFVREQTPVLVAVDGGADALLEYGLRPHLIVGDMDSASDGALRSGAELLLHTYADGRKSPGGERIAKLGLKAAEIAAPGTSEDVAMLLAYEEGASLIVAVGTHFSLVEFLDKRRAGMASTFLTRLKVGSILIDAKGLSRLYRPGIPRSLVLGLVGSAMAPIGVLVLTSPALRRWLTLLWMGAEVWLRRHGLHFR